MRKPNPFKLFAFQQRKIGLKPLGIVFHSIAPALRPALLNASTRMGFSPILDFAQQAQAVKRVIQQFSHPISAADISRKFVAGKNAANIAREQQIGHIIASLGIAPMLPIAPLERVFYRLNISFAFFQFFFMIGLLTLVSPFDGSPEK
jgi:hypothetical protein